MRKFKNLVIGGIENKLFNLILITVVLLTAAYSAVSLYHSRMLADLAAESDRRQQESIQETSDMVMESVIDQSLGQSNLLEAYLADEMFHGLQTRVEMLGDYAGKLFADPAGAGREPFAAPDPKKDGKVTSQLILAEGVDGEDPDLKDRIGLIANMSDLMSSLYGVSAETNSCFIALPDGVFLVTDDRSASKYDETGKQIVYDPRERPWYQLAVKSGGLIFTDVETDAFTGDIGIVCAMPVYVNGELKAVVGSDLFLTSMQEAVLNSEENGTFVLIINQNGHVVFSPKKEGIFQVQPSQTAQDLRKTGNPALDSFVGEAMENRTEVSLVDLEDGTYYMVGSPMGTVGWTLISACSKEAAGKPAALLRENYEKIQTETTELYRNNTKKSQLTATVLMFLVAGLMMAGSLTLAKRIVKPLNTITKRISRLSGSNLEFKMEDTYRTGDEIEELAESFASLSHKTVEYMDTIRRVTAEKERIGTELALATDIQAAMLPHIFPAFPERPDFDIFAQMNPAKEVGGDFYDYFLTDDDHLCMVIADVSGKGIPAALFMMASKIILQSCAMLGSSPGKILEKTNEAICSNNEAEMFVTVWVGILELSTGILTAANAGHEYPVIKEPHGQFEIYREKHGFVIGGMEGMQYREYKVHMEPGAKLFVYTDGVAEATNAEKELFGTERMLQALNEAAEGTPEVLLANVRRAVDDFVKEEEQFDDLTMLCLEYRGSEGTKFAV